MANHRNPVPFPRLREREVWRAADANRLADQVYAGSGDGPVIGPEEVAAFADADKILARIVARSALVEGAPPDYSWVIVNTDEDGNLVDHPLAAGGDPDSWPAREASANPLVPIDGTAIVWLRPGVGAFMAFDWAQRPRWAKVGTGSGDHYAWIEQYPDGSGSWDDLPGGLSGTSSQNPLIEANGGTGVPADTIVRIWQGYGSGAPQLVIRRTLLGDGDTLNEIQTLAILRSVDGDFTLTYKSETSAAIAFDIDDAGLEAALEAMASITDVTVTGSGTLVDPFEITFEDDTEPQELMIGDPAGLVGDQEWLFEAPGLRSLNGLTAADQLLELGTSGSDLNWDSAGDTHTLNVPDCDQDARGVVNFEVDQFLGHRNDTKAIGYVKVVHSLIWDEDPLTPSQVLSGPYFQVHQTRIADGGGKNSDGTQRFSAWALHNNSLGESSSNGSFQFTTDYSTIVSTFYAGPACAFFSNGKIIAETNFAVGLPPGDVDGISGTIGPLDTATIVGGIVTEIEVDGGGGGSGGGGSTTVPPQAIMPGGRLTLTSGTPAPKTDVTAGTILYYAPYMHDRCPIWNGSAWVCVGYAQFTISLAALTSGKVADVFLYLDGSGNLAGEIHLWTNDTTRATAISYQDGRLCKSGDKTRLYIGTVANNSARASLTVDDADGFRGVWNFYWRVPRRLKVIDSTDSWTTTTTAWHALNSSNANRVSVVIGVEEVPVELVHAACYANSVDGLTGFVGIGLDSTSANSATIFAQGNVEGTSDATPLTATYKDFPGLGLHYLQLLEAAASSGTATFYGDGGAPTKQQCGGLGWIMA